jgi:CRP-like cAMP-binding protein
MQYEMVNVIETGFMFGELGLIYNRPRAATCIAITDIELGVMGKTDFNLCFAPLQKLEEKIKTSFICKYVLTDPSLAYLSAKFGTMFVKKKLLRGNIMFK